MEQRLAPRHRQLAVTHARIDPLPQFARDIVYVSQPVLIVVLVGIEAEIARARTLRRREKRLGTYTLSAGHTRRLLARRAQGNAGVALARNLALGNELQHVVRTIAQLVNRPAFRYHGENGKNC